MALDLHLDTLIPLPPYPLPSPFAMLCSPASLVRSPSLLLPVPSPCHAFPIFWPGHHMHDCGGKDHYLCRYVVLLCVCVCVCVCACLRASVVLPMRMCASVAWDVRWALAYQHQSPSVRGHRPGRGWGRAGIRICHGLETPAGAGAPSAGREAELHLPLDHVTHRDPKSRRVRGGMATPSQLEREKEGTPIVKSSSWSSSHVRLAYCATRGERASLLGKWRPTTAGGSWPAVGMRRPTADRRSLSIKTATSMALHGFTSSRALSAMSAARRDLCWPISLGGPSGGPSVGSSESSSNVSVGCETSGGAGAVSIVPHDVGQLVGYAVAGVYVNEGGLEGRGSAWGLSSQGRRDGTGPILVRGLRRGTIFRDGLRNGPVGLLGDRPRRELAAGVGSPKVAGVAPFEGLLARGAF